MNKKMKLNILAMTLLVSQQIYCGEDKNQNAKKPIGAQSVKPSDSYLSWKNAKIAGAVVGTAAVAGGAYYYRDALMSLINGNSDPAAVVDQLNKSIEAKNAEVTQDLNAVTEKENNVAKLEEFQALPAADQTKIITELAAAPQRTWGEFGSMLINSAGSKIDKGMTAAENAAVNTLSIGMDAASGALTGTGGVRTDDNDNSSDRSDSSDSISDSNQATSQQIKDAASNAYSGVASNASNVADTAGGVASSAYSNVASRVSDAATAASNWFFNSGSMNNDTPASSTNNIPASSTVDNSYGHADTEHGDEVQ